MVVILLWFLMLSHGASELLLAYFKQPADGDREVDDGTQIRMLVLGGLSYALAWVMGQTEVGHVALPGWVQQVAMIVIVVGFGIRWVAISTLWRFFTVRVAIRKDHELVDVGLYRHLRHPSYTGIMLIAFGFGLALSNLFSILILMWGLGYVVEERVDVEEAALKKAFGDRYINYIHRTKRYLWGVY